ncbi:MAG: Ig-like domain-containing protein [Lachnospiraceae bacterium]
MIFGWIIVTDMVEADAADQKTTSIELNYHTYVLKPKKTVKLKAVCLPKDAKKRTVKWKTSNKSVATVSSWAK